MSNAPKVTKEDIEENIFNVHYFTAMSAVQGPVSMDSNLDLLTICILELKNGFTVVGTAACVSRENFNAEDGKRIARENAVKQVWPLMGYALADRLYREAA